MRSPRMNKTFISAAAALALVGSVYPATWTVTDLSEAGDYNCSDSVNLSLRDAIGCSGSGDLIDFNVSGTIPVSASGGVFDINQSVTIAGPGQQNLTFSPSYGYGVFSVPAGVTTIVSGVTVTGANGSAVVTNAGSITLSDCNISGNIGSSSAGNGMVIQNTGSLTIENSTFSDNSGYYQGPITSTGGDLTIVSSKLSGNTAVSSGNGIVNVSGGVLDINGSEFANNSANYGGAIYTSNSVVSIRSSSIHDNNASSQGGAIYSPDSNMSMVDSNVSGNYASFGNGGAISNTGNLEINASHFSSNMASGGGGAINHSTGTLTIGDSLLESNSVMMGSGGAIAHASGTTTIKRSKITDNSAASDGGAIYAINGLIDISETNVMHNSANRGGGILLYDSLAVGLEVKASTISGNSATSIGGGIALYNVGGYEMKADIVNSTISGNTATTGGGLSIEQPAYSYYVDANISHSTIVENNATTGGAFYSYGVGVSIKSTIIADSNSTSDCVTTGGPFPAPVNSYGYNLIENNSSCFGFSSLSQDISGVDPLVLSLADNGGPTLTHALDINSSARSAGSSTLIDGVTPVLTDQRGLTRYTPPAIGAYEPQPADLSVSPTSLTFDPITALTVSAEQNVTVTNIGDDPLTIDGYSLLGGSSDFLWTSYCISPLASGESCTIGVYSYPQDANVTADSLVIEDTANTLTSYVTLAGSGTDIPLPVVGLSTASYDFGVQTVNTTSSYDITLTNSGTADLTIDTVSLQNATTEFSLSGTCTTSPTIAPAGNCTLTVGFTPLDTLPYSDTINISTVELGTYPVTISGEGSAQVILSPTINFDPAYLDFGYVDANQTVSQTLTVYNNGDADLNINDIYLEYGIPEFVLTNNCPATVAPAGSCTVDVAFTPGYDYWFSDAIVIDSDDPVNPLAYVSVSGNGLVYYSYDEGIYFGKDINQSQYDALSALDPTSLTDMNLYEVRFEHDGLYRSMIDIVSGTPNQLNFYEFNSTTLQYDMLREENNFTIGSDNVMSFDNGNFLVKYIGSTAASDLNSTLFGSSGTAYEFAYIQTVDDYRFDESEYDYATSGTYASLASFMAAHTLDTNATVIEQYSTYLIGLVFDYTSGDTTGDMYEVDMINGTQAVAGSWEIKNVSGVGDDGQVLMVYPPTENYRDGEFWALRDGIVWNGELQKAGEGSQFYWFDLEAHNDFVYYFGEALPVSGTVNGSITLPSSYASSLWVEVFIDSSYEGWVGESYNLSPGDTVNFSLQVPEGVEDFRVGYQIYDSVGGLIQRGYFNGTGTTPYQDEAATYASAATMPTAVALNILSGRTISGTVTLPSAAADYTEMDITASVDVLGASTLFRHAISTYVEFAPGQSSVDYNLTVPTGDLSQKYYLAYDFFQSNDYIRQGYYGATATTPYFTDAAAVDISSGNQTGIDLDVLNGVSISGSVSIASPSSLPTYLFIRALRDDGYEIFGGADVAAGSSSVTYSFDVPSTTTAHSYKIGYYLFAGDGPTLADRIIGYWNSSGTVTNLEEAESFNVSTSAVTGKDLTVSATAGQTIAVNAGWNLLSLPSKAEFTFFDMILHFGFNEDGLVNMAKYTPTGWAYYMVKGQNETLNRFNALRSNEGFWLQSDSAFTLHLAIADDADYADELAPLYKGWNLVGTNKAMSAAELVSAYETKGYTGIESIWVYKNSSWYLYIPDTTLDAQVDATIPRIESNIAKTDGIWVKLKGE